jgi:hypothetical protein
MLQRGFQAKGARDQTWCFEVGMRPELRRIADVGADEAFYSEPSGNGDRTLDDRITTYESERLGRLLHKLKKAPTTTELVPQEAAEIVAHLAVRSGHFRRVMTEGLKAISHGAAALFARPEVMFRLFGFDVGEPTQRFTELIQNFWDEQPQLAETGIPKDVVTRMAFSFGRENLEANWSQLTGVLWEFDDHLTAQAAPMARNSHNKALAEDFLGSARKAKLETLIWELIDVALPGVILPDCAAIAISDAGEALPLMMAGMDEVVGVAIPISSRRLLLGRRPGMHPFYIGAINQQFAACSEEFFIASSDAPEFIALLDQISRRSRIVMDEALVDAFKDYEPVPPSLGAEPPSSENDSLSQITQEHSEDTGYQLTFSGCGSAETIQEVAASVQYVVNTLSPLIPLSRLDGITFAADYPAALRELDRGIPGLRPLTTASPSEGIGIAQAPIVMRDGVIKVRIVTQAWIGLGLVSQSEESVPFAVHALVHQLALVAMVYHTDTALPGALLQPVTGAVNRLLYGLVGPALDSYFAARFAAPYAPDDITKAYREMALDGVRRLRDVIPPQRIAYRFHADMDRLLGSVLPVVRSFLHSIATLAGHCAGRELPFALSGDELEQELDRSGLRAWLNTFQSDLTKFANRAGKWQSFDEFYSFTKHAERVLWQFQIIPWEKDDGGGYVTVPLAVDVQALRSLYTMTAEAVNSQTTSPDH